MAKKIDPDSVGEGGDDGEPAEGEGEDSPVGALLSVGAVVGLVVLSGSGGSGGLDVVGQLNSVIEGLTG
jgi:hypothetical protein